jgi:hypothetical protein
MTSSAYSRIRPERRPLKIFAFDPMPGRAPDQSLWRASANRITIDVINEDRLGLGPHGARIKVVDYDSSNDCYYAPVDLNNQSILMQDGLEPSESDPRFHQQMVYAVAMKVLENFDHALGRKLLFRRHNKNVHLRIFPHAFREANAFYDPDQVALFFGYFQADKVNPGPNLPGQTVFACLSHDIVAHEMTHAMVDRLRQYFKEPSNIDVPAFHEGFSDIVAIFQHFSFPDILRMLIQESHSDLRTSGPLIKLARQFGYATGGGDGLRSAVEDEKPDPSLYQKLREPHRRGSILVAAVFDAFFMTYQRRIKDLVRIATGGSGRLPEGDLHPDLVNRIANEASQTAQSILTMCIRAFDYLPPIDITFGDFLRALVTTDFEISPSDEHCERAAMIEAFRVRGIYPNKVTSLSEESLLWERVEEKWDDFPQALTHYMKEKIISDAQAFNRGAPPPEYNFPVVKRQFEGWARKHAVRLKLDPRLPIKAEGFHPSFRVGSQGQLLVELVMQFVQDEMNPSDALEFGGVPFRGGTTVIASADKTIRYIIAKPLAFKALGKEEYADALERRNNQKQFVKLCDNQDAAFTWYNSRDEKTKHYITRMTKRLNFAALHQGIVI